MISNSPLSSTVKLQGSIESTPVSLDDASRELERNTQQILQSKQEIADMLKYVSPSNGRMVDHPGLFEADTGSRNNTPHVLIEGLKETPVSMTPSTYLDPAGDQDFPDVNNENKAPTPDSDKTRSIEVIIKSYQNSLAYLNEQSTQYKAMLEKERTKADELNSTLMQRETQKAAYYSQLQEKDEEVKLLKAELHEAEAQLTGVKGSLEQLEQKRKLEVQQIEQDTFNLSVKNTEEAKEAERMEGSVGELERRIAGMQEQHQTHKASKESLEASLSSKVLQIMEKNQAITQKRDKLSSKEEELHTLRNLLARKEDENRQFNKHKAELQLQLAENSKRVLELEDTYRCKQEELVKICQQAEEGKKEVRVVHSKSGQQASARLVVVVACVVVCILYYLTRPEFKSQLEIL